MPRTARIDMPDTWYHIIARGHNRQCIFRDDHDCRVYLAHIEVALLGWAVIGGYCLMPNHVHLLVNRRQRSLGKIFHDAHGRYGNYFNKKYARTGGVFQNRFKSCLILKQEYLDTLVAYIHNNPVRAKLCPSTEEYRWSTDAVYRTGLRMMPKVFRLVPGYEGNDGIGRYRRLMAQGSVTEPPYFGSYIGTKEDLRGIERRSRERVRTEERRGKIALPVRIQELARSHNVTIEALRGGSRVRGISRPRQMIMCQLYREKFSPTEVGNYFRRTGSAVIRAVKSVGEK